MERGRSIQWVVLGLILFILGYSYCSSRSQNGKTDQSGKIENRLPGGKTVSSPSPPPPPPTLSERLDQAFDKQKQFDTENTESKEKALQTLDEQAVFLICRVVSVGKLYGRFASPREADGFKDTLKRVFASSQSYFNLFEETTTYSSDKLIDAYLAVPGDSKHRRLFGCEYPLPVSDASKSDVLSTEDSEPKLICYTKSSRTTVKTVQEALGSTCETYNPVLATDAADKNTAGELWSDDIVRALRKISLYQGTLSTFEVNITKLVVVMTKLRAMKNGEIDLDEDGMGRCESELNQVEQGLKKVSEQMSAKISKPETEEIERIWTVCRGGSTSKKSK